MVHWSSTQMASLKLFSYLCTAHGRTSLYFTMGRSFPLKIAPSHGGISTQSNTRFLGLLQAKNPNGISIGSAVFAQFTAECPYFTIGRPFSSSKVPLPTGDLDPHLIYGSLGPPESLVQAASQSVQPFCRAHYCDRQIERPCYS